RLKTTVRILPYVGGKYNPTDLEDDVAALRDYYNKLGFFDVKISAKPEFTTDKAKVTMHYTIVEGTRFKVGKILLQGNQTLSTETLRKDFHLEENDYFYADKLNRDVDGMTEKYGELGRLFAEVNATPIFSQDRPGVVDVRYKIDEDRVYRIRRIDPVINGGSGSASHTKDTVVLNSMLVAPGDLANKKLIDKSRRRLQGLSIFDSNHQAGTAPKIDIQPVEGMHGRPGANSMARAQAHDGEEAPVRRAAKPLAPSFPIPIFQREETPPPTAEDVEQNELSKLQSQRDTRQTLQRLFDEPVTAEYDPKAAAQEEETIIRAQGPGLDGPPAQNPLFNNSPQGNPLGNPYLNPSPDQPGWVDLRPEVMETQTGRISLGVGINSDAGLLGNVIVDESNFDILRVPTSFRDIMNGTAFRGGGQQFRLEAVPGNQVSRYLASWRDPFFLDTNYSLGVSGFYYTRIFEYWNEDRTGGKITLGRQIDNFLSGQFSLRLEDVDLYGVPNNSPPILTKSLGHSLLSTARVGLIHDTRDSAFLPTEGHYLEGAYEQAFGDFSYPRVDLTARQYFTMYQRPDGEGRHIFALNGQVSYTGDDTPVYERLFAGGFSSFRGFQFRGVTPVQNGIGIGGQWLALGSAEYIFPLTASEMVRGVVFTDFGTVENTVAFHDFRATAGLGLRVTIPAMGPLPIALDLGFPIARQDDDQTRMFSFYVGFLR
ncbi:MAG: BamA/TamA family outer membrane protein, partial [Planctomycetota bacterium]